MPYFDRPLILTLFREKTYRGFGLRILIDFFTSKISLNDEETFGMVIWTPSQLQVFEKVRYNFLVEKK